MTTPKTQDNAGAEAAACNLGLRSQMKLTTKHGTKVTLRTDDTFTLAIIYEGSHTESTPKMLADLLKLSTLARIAETTHDGNERSKCEKAIAIARATMEGGAE